jgi:hypothetical protein
LVLSTGRAEIPVIAMAAMVLSASKKSASNTKNSGLTDVIRIRAAARGRASILSDKVGRSR